MKDRHPTNTGIIVVAVLLAISAVIWFFIRPTVIKSDCDKRARTFANIPGTTTFREDRYNPTYTACLHHHGL